MTPHEHTIFVKRAALAQARWNRQQIQLSLDAALTLEEELNQEVYDLLMADRISAIASELAWQQKYQPKPGA